MDIYPVFKSLLNSIFNLQLLPLWCNNVKGNMNNVFISSVLPVMSQLIG